MTHRLKIALLAATGLLTVPAAASATSNEQPDDPRWCRVCHAQALFSQDEMSKTAHGDMTCRDCHQGYHFNPHEPVTAPDEDGLEALKHLGSSAPAALLACLECHDVTETPGKVAHGRKGSDEAPYCLGCHGDPHSIPAPGTLSVVQKRLAMNHRCMDCHEDAARMGKVGLSTEVIAGYDHSMHNRKLHLGSERAPGCADCHGAHEQQDLKSNPVAACGKCHDGASASFAAIGGHRPITPTAQPVGYYTQKFFAWLTFITIFLLAIHVALDLFATIRTGLQRRLAEER